MTAVSSLKSRLREPCILLAPGIYDALSALLAETAGAEALYLSGASIAYTRLARPDIGLVSMTEVAETIALVRDRVAAPLIVDADNGFGNALNVERTVRAFERAGANAVQLEDQAYPKRCGHLSGKQLVAAEEMAAKVRAAVAARRDPDFVVMARTDARGVYGFDEAVRRARLYVEAGADAVFPEALESAAEFADFAAAVRAPLLANMTEFGRSPNLDFAQLAAMGYRMVLYPVTALRAALHAARAALADLQALGHQRDRLPQLLTRRELYELLDYAGYEARDRAYFG